MIKLEHITSDKRVVYIFSGLFLAVLLPLTFVSKDISRPVTAFFLVLAAVTASLIIKKRAIPSVHRKTIAMILTVAAVFFIALYYISGIFLKYFKNPYASTFGSSVIHISTIVISIISIEIIRNILLAQESRLTAVLITLAAITLDVIISTKTVTMLTINSFMDLVGLVLFPSVTANLFYNYVSARYGALPNAIYRLIITLYVYVIPVLPGMADSLLAFLRLLSPILIYAFIDALYEKKRKYAAKRTGKAGLIGITAAFVLVISIVMLISAQFRFRLIVIATESMTGEINKGDAVIYERYDGEKIDVGQVIVFDKDGSKTVHRVIDMQYINGETRYYTKGDANDVVDLGYVVEENILGTVNFKVSYIGYPTLWMHELFDGDK